MTALFLLESTARLVLVISTARVASVVLLEAPFDPWAWSFVGPRLNPTFSPQSSVPATLLSLGLRVPIPVGLWDFYENGNSGDVRLHIAGDDSRAFVTPLAVESEIWTFPSRRRS